MGMAGSWGARQEQMVGRRGYDIFGGIVAPPNNLIKIKARQGFRSWKLVSPSWFRTHNFRFLCCTTVIELVRNDEEMKQLFKYGIFFILIDFFLFKMKFSTK